MLWLVLFCSIIFVTESDNDVSSFNGIKEPWNLPLIPKVLPSFDEVRSMMYSNSNGKRIPRHLWMAFKKVPKEEELMDYQRKMFKKNTDRNWTLHLTDNDSKLQFMEKYFYNTSLLWAYKAIHPKVGNSAADIWRYGVLWMFGGLYMDDDSYFESTWDEVIGDESLILTHERNAYNDDCFERSYRLSARMMHHRYNRTVGPLFGGRTLVSWAIFAEPRHPIMYRTMENIVELIKLEYIRKSQIMMNRHDAQWKMCMCTTGPAVLTASAREMALEVDRERQKHIREGGTNATILAATPASLLRFKIYKRDFHEFGGVFKVHTEEKKGPDGESMHYMHTMQKYSIPLLGSYEELNASNMHGRLVTGDGKELFYVLDGERRGFTDWDTFQAFNFNLRQVTRISTELLESIPIGIAKLTQEDARTKLENDRKKNEEAFDAL